MATPSRTPATSTPKTTNLTPTSVRKMASPRPVTAGKSLAYKSPMAAMKTPTPASAHSHNISTSSQPSNTPLLAHTFTEGAVNLDSPSAALMGFSNSHGLTPLPSGLDGLGLQTHPGRQAAETIPRNTEAEKLQRLQDIASLLKTKVTGRGVTRDGVVRVAQLSGFTTYWDEDLLTVAGNCVDLEIMFDGEQKDTVKDVVLKISAAGSEERQEEASKILKKDLSQKPSAIGQEPWNVLDGFAENIGRLRQLDKLSAGVNCFEAVDGLYEAFKQVWEKEKKRLTWRSELHHVCGGSIGRAEMNKQRKLGVALEYWAPRHELAALERHDQSTDGSTNIASIDTEGPGVSGDWCWTALISCEAGFPSLRVSREWLSSEILTSEESSEEPQTLDAMPLKPAWKVNDLPDGGTSVTKDDNDPMKIDGGNASVLAAANAHFTFTLDPVLYLPLSIVDSLMVRGLTLTTDRSKVKTYKQVLDSRTPDRWLRSLEIYDAEGAKKTCKHAYQLLPTHLECYPVDTVGFAHPSQLSDLMPMLRQYACLWSILQKLVSKPAAANETTTTEHLLYRPGQKIKADTVQRRSNVKHPMLKEQMDTVANNGLKIDIALSFIGTPPLMKPKLEVYAPINSRGKSSHNQECFCYAACEVEDNGKLRTVLVQIPGMDSQQAKQSAERVLALGEDIGILVEWMLDQAGG